MTTPILVTKNELDISQRGRGDGTIYAYGTTAVVDQDAKTLVLTTVNIMTDLGADANDRFNGYTLEFTASGNRYSVLDWVAASDLATVLERPSTGDTGDWTLRRALYTDDFTADNPVQNAADSILHEKWIDKAANNTASIYAAAPNGVDDGGFELNSLTDYWTASINGDGTITVNPTSPILGTYDCLIDMGTTATFATLQQSGKIDLEPGRTYGFIFTARHSGTGTEENECEIQLRYSTYGDTPQIPITFTKINAEDSLGNAGNGTSNVWRPDIADTNAWEEATLTTPEKLNAGDWNLWFTWTETDSRYDLYLDEIYIWEIGPTPADGSIPNPDTLIIAGHNMAGGFAAGSKIDAWRCPEDRSSASGSDAITSLDLTAITVDGNSPIYETFSAPTSIYPIWVVGFGAVSSKTWEAAEIWIGQRWAWDMYADRPLHLKNRDIKTSSSRARSAFKRVSKISTQRIFTGTVELVDGDESDKWKLFILKAGHGAPFWLIAPAIDSINVSQEVVFMSCRSVPSVESDPPIHFTAAFDFEEAF